MPSIVTKSAFEGRPPLWESNEKFTSLDLKFSRPADVCRHALNELKAAAFLGCLDA